MLSLKYLAVFSADHSVLYRVFVVLFRRSTGRQRHLVPSPLSPSFVVLVSRLTSICVDALQNVTHSAFEDSLSGTGGSVLCVQCE